MADNAVEHAFSADRPITSCAADLLGRAIFSESLASAIRGWRGLNSLVIALYGPWGSGKSSIKNMMLEALRESEEGCPSIVEFNPWQWLGSEQLAEAFFHEIGVALSKSDPSKEGKQRANKWRFYAKCLTLGTSLTKPLKTVFSFAGYPEANIALDPLTKMLEESARIAQEGSDALTAQAESRERNLSEVKQDLADALETLENPILVVMDDIDRLAPGEIRLLFQLVKANADFPNLIYLLLFPRDRVERSLGDPTTNDGREFLEKIVQVGFDIPLVERPRLEKVLIDGLNKLLTEENVTRHFDEQRWGNIFIPGLRPYFETLRDVRRFLATLEFHVSLFCSGGGFEVNPIDLQSVACKT